MTERSIILPGPDVRAILDGQKTQVRVVLPNQPKPFKGPGIFSVSCGPGRWTTNERMVVVHDATTNKVLRKNEALVPLDEWLVELSPLQVGSRVWVKETWQALHQHNKTRVADIPEADRKWVNYLADGNKWDAIRRPANHMPRWASRLTLEVTDVKVEQADGRWWWVYTVKVVRNA